MMQSNALPIVQFFKEKIKDGFSWFLPTEDSDDVTSEPSVAEAAYSLVRFVSQAYEIPSQRNLEGFCDTTENDGNVHYFTYEAAEAAFEGVLKIHIQNAVSSRNRNRFFGFRDNDDLYVSFSIGSSVVRSEVKKNQKNPSWNSTHILPIRKQYLRDDFDGKLHVKLFDYQGGLMMMGNKENLLGEEELTLDGLRTAGKPQSCHLKIPMGGFLSSYVTVNFTTEYYSFHDAWGKPGVPRPWKSTSGQDGVLPPIVQTIPWVRGTEKINMQPIAYFDMTATDTQAWLWKDVNPDNKVLIVAFRGTFQLKDALTNFSIKPSKLGDMREDHYTIKPTAHLQKGDIHVHGGYLNCYNSIREEILQLVYDITGWHSSWNVMVTGHSLGGALSTLAAFEFANRRMDGRDGPKISHMTFGAMCVGKPSFIEAFADTVQNSIRVVGREDPFPLFLRMCYNHTSGKVFISDQGHIDLDEDSLDEVANSQDSGDNLLDNVADAMSSFANFYKGKFGREPLSDGLAHHLPTHYIQIVKKSVGNQLQYSD